MRNNKNKHSGRVSCRACNAIYIYRKTIKIIKNRRKKSHMSPKDLSQRPPKSILETKDFFFCLTTNSWHPWFSSHFLSLPKLKSFLHGEIPISKWAIARQNQQMIGVFSGLTGHFVGFAMRWLRWAVKLPNFHLITNRLEKQKFCWIKYITWFWRHDCFCLSISKCGYLRRKC